MDMSLQIESCRRGVSLFLLELGLFTPDTVRYVALRRAAPHSAASERIQHERTSSLAGEV